MRTIEVDFDVYKTLTSRRPTEDVTENDVLRDLLGLSPKRQRADPNVIPVSDANAWTVKGVRFPADTEFRATFKGQTWLGRVEHGALVINGKKFDTPSAAAVAITKVATNGWTFWECRLPGQASWQIIKGLRRK